MRPIRLQTDGRQVSVARDEHGIPHIRAASWADALFALGYVHVLDRGTQLLFSRSIASGQATAEIAANPEMLETDRFFRRVGLPLGLHDEVAALDDATRIQLDAYCDGINAALAHSGRSLPMWATGFQPSPWNAASTLLIGKLLSFGGLAVSQLQNERLLIELIHAGVNDDALRELFRPRLDNVDFDMIRKIHMANQLSDDALELISDLPRLAGSNAWAVRPERSATAGALLASDPHLEINRLPAIWYEAVLRWGDRFVMGATLPGCPLFAVARTESVGWGVTYMKGDTVDFFVEDCRPGGHTGWQYRRGNDWFDFHLRREVIDRKGKPPDEMGILENEQGTMEISPQEMTTGYNLSIAWSGSHEGNGQAIAAWLRVILSESTLQAMDAAKECCQPTLCWVFADSAGHIGLQGCGRFPRRGNNQTGLAPIPAWDPANHWQGWWGTDVLPRIYDPPEGYVATANEEIKAPHGPTLVSQPLPDYRVRRISQRLEQMHSATVDDMQQLQYDVYSTQAEDLLAVFLPFMEEGEVKSKLSEWDRCYPPDSEEATLFLHLYRNVMMELLGKQVIGWRRMLYLCSRMGYSTMVLTTADRLLMQEDSVWWGVREKGELIRRAAERLQNEKLVPWSKVNSFHFTDRFFGNHQVGRMLGFNSRQYPMPGNHATPFQGHVLQTARRETTFAPSYHFVADMATQQAHTNLPGGPSESRFSRLYKIDVSRWFVGEYKILRNLDW